MNLNRSVVPNVESIVKVNFPLPKKLELPNGIPVFSFDLTDQDLVRIDIVFKSGSAHGKSNLVADFTAKMLREGTVSKSANEIASCIDFYGSFIEQSVNKDVTTFTLYCLTKYVNQSIELLADIIWNPIFPEQELSINKKNDLQKFQVNLQKNSVACKLEFGKLLYPQSHPYFSAIENEDFNIKKESLVQHHKQFLNLSDATIFIAGKVKKEVLDKVELAFGHISLCKVQKHVIERIDISTANELLVRKEDAVQSAIRIGRLLPIEKSSDEFIPFLVLNTILGGYFSSRLMANIREDKGFTYGIGSGVLANLSSTIFLIATEVNVDSTNATIKEISKEMDKLKTEKVSASELNRVKKFMVGSFLRSSDGPFNVADKFKSSYLHDLGDKFNGQYLASIEEVTSEKIRDLALKYLNDNEMIQVVVGNR